MSEFDINEAGQLENGEAAEVNGEASESLSADETAPAEEVSPAVEDASPVAEEASPIEEASPVEEVPPVEEAHAAAEAAQPTAPQAEQPSSYTYQGAPSQQPSYGYNYSYQQPPVQPQYQPYQQSRGYYQPSTNEYVYSPQPPKKKKGRGGKIAIIAIVCVLAAFVISIGSVSAYNFYNIYFGNRLGTNPYANDRGDSLSGDNNFKLDDYRNEDDDVQGGADDIEVDDSGEENAAPVTAPTVIRDFPSLEQLAAPDDAMSIPDIYDKVSPAVVGVSCSVRNGTQVGTGFVISDDGYVVTNAHVIEDYLSVMIVDADMNEYEAEVIGYDSMTDIAVLKVDPEGKDMVAVELGKSSELRIGELAIAIGNPLGFDLYGTMTTGIISGLNRTVTIDDNTMNLLQTSAVINNGNSGGPLIDAYGRVIGITSAKVSTQYGEGLGFAIPIDEAIPIIENLIKYGYVPGRPSLGITVQNINELMSLYYRMPQGVYVFTVTPDSGADKAGIVAGDIIIAIEGEEVTTSDELNEIKNRYAVGDTVTLTVYRGGENFDVKVVLSESTPDTGSHSHE